MTHWGWHWRVKKRHIPKPLCSNFWLSEIDSFQMFKNKEALLGALEGISKLFYEIPRYELQIFIQDNGDLKAVHNAGTYIIPIEKKSCNFGGYYYFFHCPSCDKRMRKLYCLKGFYLCRKCANLGYYSQRLQPSDRSLYMSKKIERSLTDRSGSLYIKPPWIKKATFEKARIKYIKYDEKYSNAKELEMYAEYGQEFTDCVAYDPPWELRECRIERMEE